MLSKEDITANLIAERLSITAFLATVTRNYHLAEDVYQDVCVKAIGANEVFEALEQVDGLFFKMHRMTQQVSSTPFL